MKIDVKIKKRGGKETVNGTQASDAGIAGRQTTRAIVRTVKEWIDELRQRRRNDEIALQKLVAEAVPSTRTLLPPAYGPGRRDARGPSKQIRVAFSLMLLSFWGLRMESYGQQLRDAFRKVDQSVVVVRTSQKELAPFPQQGMVSLNGLGSGVLISDDGKVLTAAHLVQSADKTVVEFSGGELIPARVTGSAFSADVAVLQLDRHPVRSVAATLGDSDRVEVGDEIFVVGAPYGLSRTLTVGHVSGRHALNKRSQSVSEVEFLQTDAAINTGSSGSPVFNLEGEVVGIISNIVSRSGGSEGVAFAATSNTARRILLDQRPFWSGIEGFLVDGDLARALSLPQPAGLLVQRVAEGSIAWRWGIHAGRLRANVEGEDLLLGGDVILAMNDVAVENGGSYDDLYASVSKLKPGDNLTIKIFRQGHILTLSIPLPQ